MLLATLSFALALKTAAVAPDGPYRVVKTVKVGGDGGFDYVYADTASRFLYIPRSGPGAKIYAYDLDSLQPAGELDKVNAHGVAVDSVNFHGFASSRPVTMWDSHNMTPIKKIPVEGRPDGILADDFNQRVYVFSHSAPNVTVLDGKDGSILGTIDLGGEPEQAVSDGAGHLYIDLEDKSQVAVVDAAAMKLTGTYDLAGHGGGPSGLAIDRVNHVLFVACRTPAKMVVLSATDGHTITDLPIGRGCDGATFNPNTMECLSSQGDGTLTVIKENSPTSFSVEQTVKTMPGAKTLTLDLKTNQIYLIAAEYGPAEPTPNGGRPRRPMIAGSFSVVVVGK